jgi:parallel beta-helix repeat protein
VAVENLTARHYTLNGILWSGVTGYRGSYVSAVNNGDYGIYAFDSYNGVLDHALGRGSPDAGFYIGGCYPCKAVLDQVVAERNGSGYSGTNSGGELYIVNSIFRQNGSGVAPNTFDVEPLPPERETTIIGNRIHDNRTGVSIAGGQRNRIERNLIQGNRTGIMLVAARDQRYYPSTGNVVRDNLILDSRRVDIAMSGLGNVDNCFEGNVHRSTLPWGLELLQGCGPLRAPVVGDPHAYFSQLAGRAALFGGGHTPSTNTSWQRVPLPPEQAGLPGGVSAPVRPALAVFEHYGLELDAIATPVPAAPTAVAARSGGRP